MLAEEENRLLTQIGPGRACGDLMRRYWLPVALSEELPAGGAPIPVRLLPASRIGVWSSLATESRTSPRVARTA